MAADLVLFDPDTVDAHEPEYVYDLPGGAKRFVAYADGIKATIVSGAVLYQDGEYQGDCRGRYCAATTHKKKCHWKLTFNKTTKGGILMSGYTIIDVDTHVTESPDLDQPRACQDEDRVPRLETDKDGRLSWVVAGTPCWRARG